MSAPPPVPGFLNQVHCHYVDDNFQELDQPLSYYSKIVDAIITVPVGFRSDGRSIPRVLTIAYALWSENSAAAWIHDFIYKTNLYPRAVCDAIFKEAILADKEDGSLSAWAMYLGVRLGGWMPYNHYVKENQSAKASASSSVGSDGIVRDASTPSGLGKGQGQ